MNADWYGTKANAAAYPGEWLRLMVKGGGLMPMFDFRFPGDKPGAAWGRVLGIVAGVVSVIGVLVMVTAPVWSGR